MLRPFGARDVPEYTELYRQHFPEEAELLAAEPEAFRSMLERAFRWDFRIVLGLLRLVGRPIVRLFAIEDDGHLAGATFLFFGGGVGYISSVVVDTPFRRRGYAKRLMAAAEAAGRARGSRHTVLDVISTNGPALELYRSLGYRRIRTVGWFAREGNGDGFASAPPPPLGGATRLRAFRRGDGRALAEVARAHQPPEDSAVRPVSPRSFRVPPLLAQALSSQSAAWVLERAGRATGYVRSTRSGAMGAGHLVPPVVDASAPEAEGEALLTEALSYFAGSSVRRVLAEAPLDDPASVARLERRGFRRALTMETLAKSVAG